MGCAMRECSDDVRLGMMRLSSSRLAGRDSPERGLEVKEGAMLRVPRKLRGQAVGDYWISLNGFALLHACSSLRTLTLDPSRSCQITADFATRDEQRRADKEVSSQRSGRLEKMRRRDGASQRTMVNARAWTPCCSQCHKLESTIFVVQGLAGVQRSLVSDLQRETLQGATRFGFWEMSEWSGARVIGMHLPTLIGLKRVGLGHLRALNCL